MFIVLIYILVSIQSVLAINPCQELSNCPLYYNNTMPDYVEGEDVVVSTELNTWMEETLETYLKTVVEAFPPDRVDDATVFKGVGGRAYMFLRLYTRTNNATYLDVASSYMETALQHIGSIRQDAVGFLWGRTGLYTLGAVVSSLKEDTDAANGYIAQVQAMFDMSTDDNFSPWDDLDAGRAGLIYAASFLQKFYGKDVITRASIKEVALATVRRGKALSDDPQHYLQWISPNDGGKWLGTSHGSAGVLSQLLDVPEILEEGSESRRLIIGTLDYIVSKQFTSGNFPSEYYDDDEDVLVQWDHGAPGIMATLAKAAKIIGDSSYEDSARKAADCTWERGLLYKGLMLCHGISGNTYMQLSLYNILGDEKYLSRALSFTQFVMDTPDLSDVNLMRKPTPSPYYFFPASWESAIMLYADLLSSQDSWSQLGMPGFEPSL